MSEIGGTMSTMSAKSGEKGSEGGVSVLSYSVREDGVAVLVMDVPGAKVNALNATFAPELSRVLAELSGRDDVKAIVLASGKPGSFIAGADLKMLAGVTTMAEAEALCRKGHNAAAQLAGAQKPIVAAVHGAALGGGFEVALACQGRVLSDDAKTVVGLPEVQLGLIPGMNGLQRMAALSGLQAALEYGLSAKTMRPARALKMGLADDVVPEPILLDTAARLALSLSEAGEKAARKSPRKKGAKGLSDLLLSGNPIGRAVMFRKAREEAAKKTGGHYPAPGKVIDVLETLAKKGFEASKDVEAQAFGELTVSQVARALMGIFEAKTALDKDTGVDGAEIAARPVERVSVLGAGLMGAGIAAVSIAAKVPVRLKDQDDAAVVRGVKSVSEILSARVRRRKITAIEREETMARLTVATDYSGLKSADVVIEAVFEDLELKQRVLAEVESHGREGVIFGSNTSSIPIGKIAARARHPENVVGMHYFSPVHRMPLLEVVRAKRTAPEVVATAVALGKKQGKTVIVVNDGVGFYTTRILGPCMFEAAWLVLEGAGIDEIDRAMTAWGWPVGPMALIDEVGMDVAAHVGPILKDAFGARIEAAPAVEKLVNDGRKGRKNGRGFYLYDEGEGQSARLFGGRRGRKAGGKRVDDSVYSLLGLEVPKKGRKPPIPVEEMAARCSLQLVNEAMHCLGEGILRSARDGDIGAIFGLGFPPFRGGPFRYVDSLGAAEALKRIEAFHGRFGARWAPAPVLVEMARDKGRFYPR
ncbi:MAG: fatty acid oxidation complex subunit alpha FadJ [Polyangiaceae bacterium]